MNLWKYLIPCLIIITTNDDVFSQKTYTVEQIVDEALNNNIAIRNAHREINLAKETRKEAYSKFFPTVNANILCFQADKDMAKMKMNPSELIPANLQASLATSLPADMIAALANPVSLSMMKNGAVASVTALQPVYTGGVLTNSNKLTIIGQQAKAIQLSLTENNVEKTVNQYVWQLVALLQKEKTISMAQQTVNEICKDVEVAVNVGVTLKNDLLQVQLRQNELESQMLKVKNGIGIMKMMIAQYCGLDTTDFIIIFNEEIFPPDLVKKEHLQTLIHTREYALLEKQVEATEIQKKIAWGQKLPTVAVGAGINYHNLLDNDRAFGMVFATVSIPISDWWNGKHNERKKQMEFEQAIDEMNDKAQLLKINMDNAWNNLVETWQQIQVAKKSIEQARENLRINKVCYKAGTLTLSDLLQAQLLLQNAEDKYIEAFAQYQIAMNNYKLTVEA